MDVTKENYIEYLGEKKMKKIIKPVEGADEEYSSVTYPELINKLKELGIDTTKHHYELQAERYDRYGSGPVYTFKFTAPGDYLAYFVMVLHRDFNKSNLIEMIEDHYGYEENWIDELPQSLEEMKEYAEENWWGDGDDYIIYLKNLDTNDFLYQGEYEPEEDEEDDDWE